MREYICIKDSSIFTEGYSYFIEPSDYWKNYHVFPNPEHEGCLCIIPKSMLDEYFREV